MALPDSSLDLSLLERVRQGSGKITARCPACAEGGGDGKGVHLVVMASGKFGCAAMPADSEHRQRIFALVGKASGRDPEERRRWKADRQRQELAAGESRLFIRTLRAARAGILSGHAWNRAEVWEDSPQRLDGEESAVCPRNFLRTLFPAESLVWTGEVFESGSGHEARWQTAQEWAKVAGGIRLGPMVSPAKWKDGTSSRCAEQVLSAPFTVLDFDGLDGESPRTQDELAAHLRMSLAVVRWMRDVLAWRLAALLWTGSKSVHAWFHTPRAELVAELREAAAVLGLDAGLIGRPEHPCRLPGQRHPKTGGTSRVLWLQLPPMEI